MNQLQLQSISPHALVRFEQLLQHEPAAFMLGSGLNVGMSDSGRTQAWQVVRDQQAVAVVVIAEDGQANAHVNVAVLPEARRQGVGTWALSEALRVADLRFVRRLLAAAGPDNVGAQKLLIKNGFSQIGHNQDRNLEFEKRVLA